MENLTTKIIMIGILTTAMFSCSKSNCKTCILNDDPNIRVEVCPETIRSYEGSYLILESENLVPVSVYAATLESSGGYKCN